MHKREAVLIGPAACFFIVLHGLGSHYNVSSAPYSRSCVLQTMTLKQKLQLLTLTSAFVTFIMLIGLEIIEHKRRRARSLMPARTVLDSLVLREVADARFEVLFSDPKKYVGPIVEGWGPEKDRRMQRYVGENKNPIPERCWRRVNETKLIVFVKSAVGNFKNRKSNRQTWMKFLKELRKVKVYHLVGTPASVQVSKKVQKEQKKYCDVVQVEVVDHYMNNTLKMVSLLKVVHLEMI